MNTVLTVAALILAGLLAAALLLLGLLAPALWVRTRRLRRPGLTPVDDAPFDPDRTDELPLPGHNP